MPGCDKCRLAQRRVAVIGAGASGLAATKALTEHGLDVTTFEQNAHVGGLWQFDPASGGHSAAYRSLRARTRKESMEFSDLKMPTDFPDYPSASQVASYLESYAERFSLLERIRFSTRVVEVSPAFDRWLVTSQARDGHVHTEYFNAVVVSNGAYWRPLLPDLTSLGQFTGRILHSHDYKEPTSFVGRRVLIVGMGVSGIEISAELLAAGAHVLCSSSRATAFLDSTTPRAQSLQSASVDLRSPVSHFTATGAVFADGSSAEVDDVIFCTGYRASFPFLSRDIEQRVTQGTPHVQLWKHMWVPDMPRIAFLGFITTNGSILPLVEAQAKWAASVFAGECTLPSAAGMRADMSVWRDMLEQLNITYKPNEVNTHAYLAEIYQQLGCLSDPRYKEYAKYL